MNWATDTEIAKIMINISILAIIVNFIITNEMKTKAVIAAIDNGPYIL